MQRAIDQFHSNFTHVRDLIGLGQAVHGLTGGMLNVDEVYRSALAMTVSALDHYVHEKTLQGMLDVHGGQRLVTPAFNRYSVRLAAVRVGLLAPASDAWLASEIRLLNSGKSFQSADAVADAVRCFSSVALWPAVSAQLGVPVPDLKARLDLIVDRRNKIVHEFDNEPTGLGQRWPISAGLVTDAADFVEDVVEAIEVVT